jgi:hypothetical protein
MAIALTQSATGNGVTITLNDVASGALLTLQTSYYEASATNAAEATPGDTQGTWSVSSAGIPGEASAQEAGSSIFHQANVAAGTHLVSPDSTKNDFNYTLCEWSGAATSSPLDQFANAATDSFSGTSQATGTTGVTAQADELVLIALGLACIVGVADVGFTDPVAGFTTRHKVVNDSSDIATFHAYKITSATGAQSATFNWTDNEAAQFSGAAIATFKANQTAFPIAWTSA